MSLLNSFSANIISHNVGGVRQCASVSSDFIQLACS